MQYTEVYIEEKVKDILYNITGIPVAELEDTLTLDELGIDSLDKERLLESIDDEFCIMFTEPVLMETTIGTLTKRIVHFCRKEGLIFQS